MTTKLEVSRNQHYGMRIIIAVLIAVLLWIWWKWPSPPPDTEPPAPNGGGLIRGGKGFPALSDDQKKFLRDEGYPVIVLPRVNGGINILDPDGRQIEPCKFFKGMEDPECQLNKVNVKTSNQITIFSVTEGDPTNCMYIRVDGASVKVHADGPNAGLKPCEPTGSHTHYVP